MASAPRRNRWGNTPSEPVPNNDQTNPLNNNNNNTNNNLISPTTTTTPTTLNPFSPTTNTPSTITTPSHNTSVQNVPPQTIDNNAMNDGPQQATSSSTEAPPPPRSGRAGRWGAPASQAASVAPTPQQQYIPPPPPPAPPSQQQQQQLPSIPNVQKPQQPQPAVKQELGGDMLAKLLFGASSTTASTTTTGADGQQYGQNASNGLQADAMQYFQSLPNGKLLIQKYRRHLVQYTPDHLAQVLPPQGFSSIPPPVGYTPPTRTEANMVFLSNTLRPDNNANARRDEDQNIQDNLGFTMNDPNKQQYQHVNKTTMTDGGDEDGSGEAAILSGAALEYNMVQNHCPEEIQHLQLSRVDYAIFKDLFQNSTQQLVNNYKKLIETSPQAQTYFDQLKAAKGSAHFDVEKLAPKSNKHAATNDVTITNEEKLKIQQHNNQHNILKKNYHHALMFVLLIKNGGGKERKQAQRRIIKDGGKQYKLLYILPPIMSYLEYHIQQNTIDPYERHLLFSFMMRLLTLFRVEFAPYLKRLLNITRTLLINPDHFVRHEGGAFIQALTKILTPNPIIRLITPDVSSEDENVRDVTARIFAYLASVVGIKTVLPFLKAIIAIPDNIQDKTTHHLVKKTLLDTGLRIIQKISVLLKNKVAPEMNEMISCLLPLLKASQIACPVRDPRIIASVLNSITHLCDAASPYICPALDQVQSFIFTLLPQSAKFPRALAGVIRCITSFLGNLPRDKAQVYWENAEEYATQCCTVGDSSSLIIGVKCMDVAIGASLIPSDQIEEHIVPFVMEQLLTAQHCMDQKSLAAIKGLFLTMCKHVNFTSFLTTIINFFTKYEVNENNRGNNHILNVGCCQILAAIVMKYSAEFQTEIPAYGALEQKLINYLITLILNDFATPGHNGVNQAMLNSMAAVGADGQQQQQQAQKGLFSAFGSTKEPELFQVDSKPPGEGNLLQNRKHHVPAYILNSIDTYGAWTTHPFIETLTLVLTSIGATRAEKHIALIYKTFKYVLSNSQDLRRYQAAVIMARCVNFLTTPNQANKALLQFLWLDLGERLGEEKPLPLSAILCALSSVVGTMKKLNFFIPDDDLTEEAMMSATTSLNPRDDELVTAIASELVTPSPTDCLTRIVPVLQNAHECVVLCCCRLLAALGTFWGSITPPNEWLRIITQYVTTHLNVQHRVIRKSVVRLVGVCSLAIGSADVILKLLPHLDTRNRTVRVGITSCIGCVAESCGISMVLPLLYHYYEVADFKTSTGILKAIVICIQQCAHSEIEILPQAIYPLLAHCLTTKYSKILSIGLQIASTLLLSATSNNYNEVARSLGGSIAALVHPLRGINYNVNSWWWEYRKCVGALSGGIGMALLRSLYTGMFHPAQRVRENHWVWYNHLLTLKQHQLPMHQMKMTMNDKTVYNPQNQEEVTEYYDRMAKAGGYNPAEDEPLTQYADPYVFSPLTLPF